MFTRAQRQSAKLRLALMGPAGSGKTYSALVIAKGLTNNQGKIAVLDSERGSASLYSHLCAYDVAELAPPFHPQKYINAIHAAEQAGYDVLIIDSLSHAWSGEGGVLEMQDRAAKSTRNTFEAWRLVTPAHNALVDAILAANLHVIVTLRTKVAYDVTNENGKTKVNKVGLAPVQRDGLEYEFTVVLDLSIDGHVAVSTKDRTQLFDGNYFTPSQETGKQLARWLQGDVQQAPPPAAQHHPMPPKFEPKQYGPRSQSPKAPSQAPTLPPNTGQPPQNMPPQYTPQPLPPDHGSFPVRQQ